MDPDFLPLDVFGQTPRLHGLYTQLCFTFELKSSDAVTQLEIVNHLRTGLKYLADRIPWVGGNVVKTAGGIYAIQCTGDPPSLTVRDATTQMPHYDTMRQARFPASMLHEADIASRPTLPTQTKPCPPVFLVRATFVKNGLVLNFDAQHNCMDMRAQAELIRLFAKACRAEPFTTEEMHLAHRATYDFAYETPGAGKLEVGKDASASHEQSNTANANGDLQKTSWANILFSSASLTRLKDLAAQDMTTDFISTDDALSALLWQAITRARRQRIGSAEASCKFERQVDARKHVGVPNEYMGNMTFKSEVDLPLDNVLKASLGQLASHLRRALDPTPGIQESMRQIATKLQEQLNTAVSNKAPAQRFLPPNTIRFSSWAKEQCSGFNFGHLIGMPDAVRRPCFKAWEGLAYFLPKARDGEITVMICLSDKDLKRLRQDEVLCSFGDYIG